MRKDFSLVGTIMRDDELQQHLKKLQDMTGDARSHAIRLHGLSSPVECMVVERITKLLAEADNLVTQFQSARNAEEL